jgi:hypothetical protein
MTAKAVTDALAKIVAAQLFTTTFFRRVMAPFLRQDVAFPADLK